MTKQSEQQTWHNPAVREENAHMSFRGVRHFRAYSKWGTVLECAHSRMELEQRYKDKPSVKIREVVPGVGVM